MKFRRGQKLEIREKIRNLKKIVFLFFFPLTVEGGAPLKALLRRRGSTVLRGMRLLPLLGLVFLTLAIIEICLTQIKLVVSLILVNTGLTQTNSDNK